MKRALIHFAALRQEFVLPPLIPLIPPRCPLIEVDNPTECVACVDFTAVQDFGMMEQNITGFYLCWALRLPVQKLTSPAVNNLLCLFNAPEMAFWDNPNTPVINGRIIKIYVNVKDRVIFFYRISISVPSDRRTVFRQFENKGFIAWDKIGADDSVQQITNRRMSKKPQREFIRMGVQIGQIVRDPFRSTVAPFICRSTCQNLVNKPLTFALCNSEFIWLDHPFQNEIAVFVKELDFVISYFFA